MHLRVDKFKTAKALAVEHFALVAKLYGEKSLEYAKAAIDLAEIQEMDSKFNKAKVGS